MFLTLLWKRVEMMSSALAAISLMQEMLEVSYQEMGSNTWSLNIKPLKIPTIQTDCIHHN